MATPKRQEKLWIHGEPTAPRVVIPQADTSGCVSCVTQVPQQNLKARLLEALSTSVRATRLYDRLVVIMVGHGTIDRDVSIDG